MYASNNGTNSSYLSAYSFPSPSTSTNAANSEALMPAFFIASSTFCAVKPVCVLPLNAISLV